MHSGIFHETSDRNVHCTEKQLNICSLNIQGLMKYSDNTQFQDYCKLVDIIALYETWQSCGNDFKTFYRDTQILMLFENEHEILPGGLAG